MRSDRFIFFLKTMLWSLGLLFLGFMAAGLYLYRISLTLPQLGSDPTAVEAARTSVIYAGDGSVLAEWHGEQDRKVVDYEVMPRYLLDAVVAIEDERFYEHHGVDIQAIARALRVNAEQKEYAQGGSTITQQLVKMLFTEGDRTFTRKLREALLAFQVEYRTDKEAVLESYLNLVYLGNGRYGVESASQAYFRKSVGDLSLAESALLAGVIRAPSTYSPAEDPGAAVARRDLVIRKMREQGFISTEEERRALATTHTIAPASRGVAVAPYFVEHVKQDLIRKLGADRVFTGGLRVYTTLDRKLQAEAERAVRAHLGRADDPDVAVVSLDYRTGRVLAMVGGRDFRANQFNLAAQGRRQPGSAFKPFVLVTALQKGIGPDTVYAATPYTTPVKDGTWSVQNYENDKTSGSMTLRAATNWSVNAVYARLIMEVGSDQVVHTAERMGITSPLESNPAIALGGLKHGVSPLEMASAYGTIAHGGMHLPPIAVDRVENDTGEVVLEPEAASERAVSQDVAVKTALMLHDVVEHGTGTAARIPGVWTAGKTGTTQSYRDAWFVGFAGDLCTSVWVGFREAQVDMTSVRGIKVSGGSFPARIWRTYTERALEHENSPVTEPSESKRTTTEGTVVTLCSDTLVLANKRCPQPIDLYLESALVPTGVCPRH